MPDRVAWLPTNAHGCSVRGTLAAWSGDVVSLAKAADDAVAGTTAYPYVIEVVVEGEEDEDGAEDAAADGTAEEAQA